MSTLYTKNGRPLRVSGCAVFGPSGRQIGRINRKKVFGSNGRYVGTIASGRLVYRSTDSASVGSSFAPMAGPRSAHARAAGSALWGEEPSIEE